MGGGLMQLVAYGAQDVYLTGNPQITFFKVVYRRHTNFSMECIEQPLDSAKFGGLHTVQVLRNGDLAGKMYLMTTLPSLKAVDNTGAAITSGNRQVAWVNRVGHALIDNIECTVGGSLVDKHYGLWYDLWYELTHTLDQEAGYKKMIGDVSELTTLGYSHNPYVLYVPLQFWFNRNTGLALPLIALQYHEVRFNIKLNKSSDLIVTQAGAASSLGTSPGDLSDTALLVDYIYLDSEERRRFAQVGHEYLIEQVQFGGQETLSGKNNKVKLDFNHPCKELVWVAQSSAFTDSNKFLIKYDDNKTEQENVDEAARKLAWGMVARTVTDVTVNDAWANVTGAAIANGTVGIVTRAGTPGNTATPTINVVVTNNSAGQINAGNALLRFITPNATTPRMGNNGVDLLSKLKNITVNVTVTNVVGNAITAANPIALTDVVVNEHTLTMADVSVPVSALTAGVAGDLRVNTADVTLVQPLNYGLDLAGNGSLVSTAKLQLNGHDRFDEREGPYFNYVQPAQHHTRTPSDGVNVYSFGLHPEQHQPSGTANLSRIDTTLLWITIADNLRNKGTNVQLAGNGLTGNQLSVFAFSYNVFRIMSGMGGLAYAN
jgi:hypothetical protein